jgi:FMN phosphatase YigB (HAD superfamily)
MNQKLVMFDFADTIARLSPSKEELLQNYIINEIGITISLEKISEVYHYATNLMFYSSVTIHDIEDKQKFYNNFNENLIALLGLTHLIDSSKLFNYFKEHGQHWQLKNGVQNLFEELHSKKCFISLVSNFDTRLYNILENMGISNHFDSIFISQEVGLEKPNIDFFDLPIKQHNIPKQDCYFIGDSYMLDYLPSNTLGINSILLDENNKYENFGVLTKINQLLDCKKIIFEDIK